MTLYALAAPISIGIWDGTADAPGVPVHSQESLWDFWVTFPARRPRLAPRVQRQVRDVLDWTGWSSRTLAEIVGTTHPTISAIAAGRSTTFTRAPGLPFKLAELHGLLERLNIVAGDDAVELNRMIGTPPAEGERTGLQQLSDWNLTDAWLAAVNVASPRRQSGMMRGRFPARAGQATTALHE